MELPARCHFEPMNAALARLIWRDPTVLEENPVGLISDRVFFCEMPKKP
jgi:hypothetical protein